MDKSLKKSKINDIQTKERIDRLEYRNISNKAHETFKDFKERFENGDFDNRME